MKRVLHAITHETSQQIRSILIASRAIAGTMLLVSLLGWLGEVDAINVWEGYPPVMILFGLLITTGIFSELRSPGKRIEYLLRPATAWEKVLAKLIVSTVVVWLTITIAFVLATLLGVLLYFLLGGDEGVTIVLYKAFADGAWLVVAWKSFVSYLPAHAIFFFGSVYFRKHAAGKTLLSIVGWVGSYAILSAVTARMLFAKYFNGRFASGRHRGGAAAETIPGPVLDFSFGPNTWEEIAPFYLRDPDALRIVVSVTVVLVFWLLAIVRLRETEA